MSAVPVLVGAVQQSSDAAGRVHRCANNSELRARPSDRSGRKARRSSGMELGRRHRCRSCVDGEAPRNGSHAADLTQRSGWGLGSSAFHCARQFVLVNDGPGCCRTSRACLRGRMAGSAARGSFIPEPAQGAPTPSGNAHPAVGEGGCPFVETGRAVPRAAGAMGRLRAIGRPATPSRSWIVKSSGWPPTRDQRAPSNRGQAESDLGARHRMYVVPCEALVPP